MTYEYLAGLFDGEGCIVLSFHNGYPFVRVAIAQKNRALLELVKDFTQLGSVYSGSGKRACFEWVINKKPDICQFLSKVTPYLILRKAEAEIAHQLCLLKRSRGNEYTKADVDRQFDLISELEAASKQRRGE